MILHYKKSILKELGYISPGTPVCDYENIIEAQHVNAASILQKLSRIKEIQDQALKAEDERNMDKPSVSI